MSRRYAFETSKGTGDINNKHKDASVFVWRFAKANSPRSQRGGACFCPVFRVHRAQYKAHIQHLFRYMLRPRRSYALYCFVVCLYLRAFRPLHILLPQVLLLQVRAFLRVQEHRGPPRYCLVGVAHFVKQRRDCLYILIKFFCHI